MLEWLTGTAPGEGGEKSRSCSAKIVEPSVPGPPWWSKRNGGASLFMA
jgi:hypothetical protein